MKRPLLALAGMLALAPAASAQTPAPGGNAAVDYWRGAYMLQQQSNLDAIRNLDWSKVGSDMDPERLPEEFKTAAAAIQKEPIEALMRGARTPRCDFQIEMEKGPFALMPHLGAMRTAVRVLRVDARRLAVAGDSQGSAQRLVTALGMADHLRRDPILISNLVAASIVQMVIPEVEAQLDAEVLDDEARRTLADAFRRFEGEDPFGLKASMLRGERDLFLSWIRREFHGPSAGRDLVEAGIVAMTVGGAAPAPADAGNKPGTQTTSQPPAPPPQPAPNRAEEAIQTIALMNEAQLRASVDLLWPYYDQVVAAWEDPNASARLRNLEQKAASGDFGPLAQVFAPAVGNARGADMRVRADVARILERLAE